MTFEDIAKNLKTFIANNMTEELSKLEDEEVILPTVEEENISIGVVDVDANENDILCNIYPDEESDNDTSMACINMSTSLTVTFLFRNADYDILIKRMIRYSAAFRRALFNDYTINNSVDDVSIGVRKFYPDCGTTENQMTGVEIPLVISTSEEV